MNPTNTKAVQLIAQEVQSNEAMYETAHDDLHTEGDLATAASVYARLSTQNMNVRANVRATADRWTPSSHLYDWPWEELPKLGDDSNESRVHNLVKAAALITAEIARRLRIA